MNDDRESPRVRSNDLRVIGGEGLLPAFRQQPWAATLMVGEQRSTYVSSDLLKARKKGDREEWF